MNAVVPPRSWEKGRDLVSIAICTANRAESLRETLAALAAQQVPSAFDIELVVVDNAPGAKADPRPQAELRTEAVVRDAAAHLYFPVRCVSETRPGASHARNRALVAARGDIFLFTDDDVRPPPDWIERMVAPIRENKADTVGGGVRLAPYLLRPWMEKLHKGMLASTEWAVPGEPLPALIGASMAFHRRVLEKVPWFDVELGPGTAIGGGEEILFSFQTREAGYRMASLTDVVVEHHADPSRLSRASFAKRLAYTGREAAYFRYHWEHEPLHQVRRNVIRSAIDLWRLRRDPQRAWPYDEGASYDELKLIELHCFYRQYLIERRRPPNYDRRGTVKKHGVLADLSMDIAEEGTIDADRH